MKIILIVDDKKLGKKNSIVEVADSYARNVLIPKKIAIPATNENLNALSGKLEKEKREFENNVKLAEETKKKLEDLKELNIKVKTSKDGKMFGSVTTKDISEALVSYNIDVPKQNISLDVTIKALGTYEATIKLFNGISASLKVTILG